MHGFLDLGALHKTGKGDALIRDQAETPQGRLVSYPDDLMFLFELAMISPDQIPGDRRNQSG